MFRRWRAALVTQGKNRTPPKHERIQEEKSNDRPNRRYTPQPCRDNYREGGHAVFRAPAEFVQQPHLLGIGLSEDTAIIVTGDKFEVMGDWMVAVHDNTRAYQPWEKPYFVLAPGDMYDMRARRIVVPVQVSGTN